MSKHNTLFVGYTIIDCGLAMSKEDHRQIKNLLISFILTLIVFLLRQVSYGAKCAHYCYARNLCTLLEIIFYITMHKALLLLQPHIVSLTFVSYYSYNYKNLLWFCMGCAYFILKSKYGLNAMNQIFFSDLRVHVLYL